MHFSRPSVSKIPKPVLCKEWRSVATLQHFFLIMGRMGDKAVTAAALGSFRDGFAAFSGGPVQAPR